MNLIFCKLNDSRLYSLIPFFNSSGGAQILSFGHPRFNMFLILIETFKNDVRNGFGKAWQYSFKLQMLLSGVVYHLSFIKWFFSIETQKSSICHVFYDDLYINRFVNYLQDQVIRKYILSLERLFACTGRRARVNSRAKTSKKFCKKITK